MKSRESNQLTFGGDLSPLGVGTLNPRRSKAFNPKVPISGQGAGVGGVLRAANLNGFTERQLTFGFNKIKLDKGMSLALKGRHVNKRWVFNRVDSFIDVLLADLKTYLNRKKFKADCYYDCLSMILANLLFANNKKAQIVIPFTNDYTANDPDNPASVTPKTIKPVCEFLAARGYILKVTGKANQYERNCSWIAALMPLIELFEKHKAVIELHENTPCAIVRDADKKIIKPYTNRAKGLRLKKLSAPAKAHNEKWLNHTATLSGDFVLPWLRRVFNLNMDLGGRFYGEYQSLTKEERKRILIDGERTIEPDFKSIHFSILYAQEGLQLIGDPYQVSGYERATIKKVCLQLMNVESLSSFKACITRSGKEKTKEAHRVYLNELAAYQDAKENNLKANEPKKPKILEGFIEGLPVGVSGRDLIDSLLERHRPIAHHFGVENIGLKLQNTDSEIMSECLALLSGVPCLPVHDSIRCKISDSVLVIDAMEKAFKNITGFECSIDKGI